jgi:hypothetical protein
MKKLFIIMAAVTMLFVGRSYPNHRRTWIRTYAIL